MKKDLIMTADKFSSSFLSCEKDIEIILKKLFIESKPYSNYLKRLLVINTKDCLDNTTSEAIQTKLEEMTLAKLIKEDYIKIAPKLKLSEHEEVKSYILITMDNYTMNETNPQFRDCTVTFDIICNTDYWDLGDYRVRPLKIAGYIDGILNNAKLTGIGTFQFIGCNELILDENFAGYSLTYSAIHWTDDSILPNRD